jgi:hypothetical protein
MAKVTKTQPNPTHKNLAAMYGNKNKITRGDIITAAKKNKRRA